MRRRPSCFCQTWRGQPETWPALWAARPQHHSREASAGAGTEEIKLFSYL